jgi:beta-glucosidase
VYASPQERSVGALAFDWYDPVASHALRTPGRRRPDGSRSWSVGRALWDVPVDPAGLRVWCRTEAALRPGLPLWVVENGMATRVEDDRPVPREDGWDRPRYIREHFAAMADAVADGTPVTAYLHWSLVDNYEWGSYAPRFGIFGMDRSDPSGAVRWLDTDAAGDDAAGAFADAVRALSSGDRSALDGPV